VFAAVAGIRLAQQLDRAEGTGDDVARARARTAAGVLVAGRPGVSDTESDGAGPVGEAGPVREAGPVAGPTAGGPAVAGDAAGAEEACSGALPPPYIQVLVGCTTPGLSVMPDTVA
jgi:hypothetical protein